MLGKSVMRWSWLTKTAEREPERLELNLSLPIGVEQNIDTSQSLPRGTYNTSTRYYTPASPSKHPQFPHFPTWFSASRMGACGGIGTKYSNTRVRPRCCATPPSDQPESSHA